MAGVQPPMVHVTALVGSTDLDHRTSHDWNDREQTYVDNGRKNIRRNWKPIVSLLLFVLALIQTTALQAQPQKGVIVGQIGVQIGASAEAVRVAAVDVNDASGALVSIARTDAAGRYRLEDIPPGEYRIIAGALVNSTYYPGTTNAAVAKTVAVTAGTTISGIDFQVVLAPIEGNGDLGWVVISGRLIGTGGGLVPQAVKDLVVTWGFGPSHETSVQPDGTFALRVRWNERYGVKIPARSPGILVEDFYLQSLTYCQHDLLKEPLRFDAGCSGILATLAQGIQITGTVRKENGDPANVTVYLIPRVLKSERPDLPRQTVTGAEGHFVLHGVAPGEYTLSSAPDPVRRSVTITAGREPITPVDLVLSSDGSLAPAR
jgi:hypothetical protein